VARLVDAVVAAVVGMPVVDADVAGRMVDVEAHSRCFDLGVFGFSFPLLVVLLPFPNPRRFLFVRRGHLRAMPDQPSSKPSDHQSRHTFPDSADPPSKTYPVD